MRLIYKARDIAEAHIVSGLLNNYDIENHIGGQYLQGGIGELAALDFANIFVAEENISLAKSIIIKYEGKAETPVLQSSIEMPSRTLKLGLIILIDNYSPHRKKGKTA